MHVDFFNWHSDSGKRYIWKILLYGQYFVINTSINCNENQVDFNSLKDCLVWFKLELDSLLWELLRSSIHVQPRNQRWANEWLLSGTLLRLPCQWYSQHCENDNLNTFSDRVNIVFIAVTSSVSTGIIDIFNCRYRNIETIDTIDINLSSLHEAVSVLSVDTQHCR